MGEQTSAAVTRVTAQEVWRALEEIHDPEIPVVSIVELGIVRDVNVAENEVRVTMTPTFSGCPALDVIRDSIAERIRALGVERVSVNLALSPAWTSDWISESGRAKLRAFGLAPPPVHGGNVALFFDAPVACPYCGSTDTRVKNNFGSTLCRAIYYCRHCLQAFEQFKPL